MQLIITQGSAPPLLLVSEIIRAAGRKGQVTIAWPLQRIVQYNNTTEQTAYGDTAPIRKTCLQCCNVVIKLADIIVTTTATTTSTSTTTTNSRSKLFRIVPFPVHPTNHGGLLLQQLSSLIDRHHIIIYGCKEEHHREVSDQHPRSILQPTIRPGHLSPCHHIAAQYGALAHNFSSLAVPFDDLTGPLPSPLLTAISSRCASLGLDHGRLFFPQHQAQEVDGPFPTHHHHHRYCYRCCCCSDVVAVVVVDAPSPNQEAAQLARPSQLAVVRAPQLQQHRCGPVGRPVDPEQKQLHEPEAGAKCSTR